MSNFKDFLSNLVNSCNGLYGAVVMGLDGMTRSKFFKQDLPMSSDVYEAFIAEYSPLVQKFHEKSLEMDIGETQKLTAQVGEVNIFFKMLENDNFLAVISSHEAYAGKVEYYSNIEAQKFNEAFGG